MVWGLAIAVVAVVIVLVILVGMLLGANSWMAHGVERGNTVVRRTIPQVSNGTLDTCIHVHTEILLCSMCNVHVLLSLPPSVWCGVYIHSIANRYQAVRPADTSFSISEQLCQSYQGLADEYS